MSLRRTMASLVIFLLALPAVSLANGRDVMESLGVPLFPGATHRPERSGHNNGKATVSLEDVIAGGVSADVFVSSQPPDKVLSFYRNELKQLGSLTECKDGRNAKVHVRVDPDAVADPSGCQPFNFGSGEAEIKAVRSGEQFIISVGAITGGSEFAIVHVQSARKCNPRECNTMI